MMQARHVQQRLDGGSDTQSPATRSPNPFQASPAAAAHAPGKENIDSQDEGGELLAAFERASQEIERASQDMPTENVPHPPHQAHPASHQRDDCGSQHPSQAGSQGDFMQGVLQECIGPSKQQQQQSIPQGPAVVARPTALTSLQSPQPRPHSRQQQQGKSEGVAALASAPGHAALLSPRQGRPTGMMAAADATAAALHTPQHNCSPLAHPRTSLLRGPAGGDSGRSTATRASLGGAVGLEQDSLRGDEVATPGRHGSWMGTQVGVFDGSMSADESPGLLSMDGTGTYSEPPEPAVQPLPKGGTEGMPSRDDGRIMGGACQVNYLDSGATLLILCRVCFSGVEAILSPFNTWLNVSSTGAIGSFVEAMHPSPVVKKLHKSRQQHQEGAHIPLMRKQRICQDCPHACPLKRRDR